MLLPVSQPISGIFLALVAVARGVRTATILALLAGGTLALFALIIGASPLSVVAMIAIAWLPVYLLATIWQVTRSEVLVLQLSLIIAVAALLSFHLVVGDVTLFWQPIFDAVDEAYRQAGAASPFATLQEEYAATPGSLAVTMTTAVTAAVWLAAVFEFMLGGALYNKLPGERPRFGRIRDIDFGRVLATIFVAVTVVSLLSGSTLLEEVAALMFAAFLLQGFVVAHWLHLEGHAPVWVVLIAYASVLLLWQYALMAIAVVGYLDALFRARRRLVEKKGSRQ